MPTPEERQKFQTDQAAVVEAGREAEAARLGLFTAREGLKRARSAGRDSAQHEAAVLAGTENVGKRLEQLAEARAALEALTDPRTGTAMVDDATPFLLFPLRLETRFGSVTQQGVTQQQLWVRVYPDDCVIDSFEPLPSETEITSVRRYWVNLWKARGIEAQERAAWRSLVASHGSGRAAWLEKNYRPLNPEDQPDDPVVNALVLVIPTEAPLAAAEAGPLATFWTAVWKADGDHAAIEQAVDTLRNAIQDDTRAEELADQYEPANLSDEPAAGLDRDDITVTVKFLKFPPAADQDAAQQSWNQPARSRVLPDRFVLLGYDAGGAKVLERLGQLIPWPLTVGPDPQAPAAEQIRQENGEIVVGEELKWLTDFDRAVAIGMGFRVDLTAAQASQGFARLLVLGLRLSAHPDEGQRLLDELLQHHRDGSTGLAVLPQGIPTNNTEEESSGFTRSEEADRTFDERLHPGPALRATAPWNEKLDGEWLADALGIDPGLLDTVGGSRNTDQLEAQAMNVALWPATLGYGLETMMHPLFDDEVVERVRWFYQRFVTGRGLLPAIRVGSQPYGILPITVMSRLTWADDKELRPIPGLGGPLGFRRGMSGINQVLKVMAADWAGLVKDVSRVGGSGDPHKVLLDIIGLHPTSVEHYQRYAESMEDLYNRMRFYGWGGAFWAQLTAAFYQYFGMEHLQHLGYAGEARPDILNRFFLQGANLLSGPFIDEVPLSETSPLQDQTTDARNYIEWLRDAAADSVDTLRQESGFIGNKPPRALLYLFLRHGLLQAYWDSSLRLNRLREVMDANAIKLARREPPFIHIAGDHSSESRWRMLYDRNVQLTGDPELAVGDYLTGVLDGGSPATSQLDGMLDALDVLKGLSTARLERLFAEHLDTCTYRVDAWQQGLLHYALGMTRYTFDNDNVVARKGILLGAFGWLEEVRPRMRQLVPVPTLPGLDPSFHAANLASLVHDSTNGGYIHAPSLNQAVAAAVLRNGYLANATPANPSAFAVNLSSDRVRLARSFLEGVRQGQSLGALLGYQLERGLHDAYGLGEVDEYIYALRKKFPLVADRHPDTASNPADPVPIEVVEARNVVDGLQLVEHVKKLSPRTYPFDFTDLPPAAGGKGAAIDQEVERLLNITDAIADVKVADSVYHAVQSNYDAVAATLESSGSGQLPPEPAIVETPRTGRTVTHRVALHLTAGLNEDTSPIAGLAVTPRARAEPAVNAWLAGKLPQPDKVACTVEWFDVAANGLKTKTVTQKDLGLQPIDLLYIASLETEQAMTELDDRVRLYAHENFVTRPDSAVTISYRTPIAGSVTFFELAPLIRSLRPLILHSRPLRPTDAVVQGRASSSMDALVRVKSARITKVETALKTLRDDMVTFRDALEPLHAEPPNEAQIRAGLDNRLTGFAALLVRAATFGLGDSGWGFILDFKQDWFASVLDRVRTLADRFQTRLNDCDARLLIYDATQAGMTDDERYSALAGAERLVRATLTIPPPATPAAYRTAIGLSRGAFAARLTQLRNLMSMTTQSVIALRTALLAAVNGPPPVSALDPEPVELANFDQALVKASADLLARSKRLIKLIEDRRLDPAADSIASAAAAADPEVNARLLSAAVKQLLGEDAILIPEFKLDDDQGLALQAAYAAGVAGEPLQYQRTVKKTPEPADTWLYGVARVREKMRLWEQSVMLEGAFGAAEPDLTPLQVPWTAGEHWLGLEFPATYVPDGERLCYTAHFTQAFDRTQWQCGLLLDDWTEVIPGPDETTGLAFHYDRPNAEAPQAWLLVTPPQFVHSWQWQDIVDAVRETLDQAKSRAVEPVHLEGTTYVQFLPMTVMAATLYQVSIMTNLARNNDFYTVLQATTDG